jgi:hypothetical protein
MSSFRQIHLQISEIIVGTLQPLCSIGYSTFLVLFFRPSAIRCLVIISLELFDLLLLSPFDYSTWVTFDVQFCRPSVIRRLVLLPLVVCHSVIRRSVSRPSVAQSLAVIPGLKREGGGTLGDT